MTWFQVPGLQWQRYDPQRLAHLCWQMPGIVSHSLMSMQVEVTTDLDLVPILQNFFASNLQHYT